MTQELTVINFTNFTNKDFEGMWGGEITVIKAGVTMAFPKFLAEHFAFQLAQRHLIDTVGDWGDKEKMKEMQDKALGQIVVPATETVEVVKEEFEGLPIEVPVKIEIKAEEKVVEAPIKTRGRKKVN